MMTGDKDETEKWLPVIVLQLTTLPNYQLPITYYPILIVGAGWTYPQGEDLNLMKRKCISFLFHHKKAVPA